MLLDGALRTGKYQHVAVWRRQEAQYSASRVLIPAFTTQRIREKSSAETWVSQHLELSVSYRAKSLLVATA